MDIIKALRYLNSADGPHISLEKLAIYCGVSKTSMFNYISGKIVPPKRIRKQLERGISDLVREIYREWPI